MQKLNHTTEIKEIEGLKLTLKASFSKKWEIPLGNATSYLDPESISTTANKKKSKATQKSINCKNHKSQ